MSMVRRSGVGDGQNSLREITGVFAAELQNVPSGPKMRWIRDCSRLVIRPRPSTVAVTKWLWPLIRRRF
jgi:hypothetical protein